jgi:hypothetical protein
MVKKFLVTEISTEIHHYEQEVIIPDDKIILDEDGEYDDDANRELAEEMAKDKGGWDETNTECIENEFDVIQIEKEEA